MTTKVTQAAVVAVYNQLSRYVAANHTAASARRAMSDLGFMLGCKALERLLAVQPTLELAHPLEERDIIKFVCKELWEWLFGKQADRLQTNKKGGYVIVDQTFRWSVVEGWSVGVRAAQHADAQRILLRNHTRSPVHAGSRG
ncbi:MAG: hypothetical protein KVP17_001026 [Porospora cf. gigantea B]|uniref:uncharacterized protein n=1 Tax=Porospora cf. gigantea B TaxID=2853592 RepID=UPI003571BB1A|nr:MAG: hypothetical protein KVP17_001026 [Porospora cf. gigantea B]